MDLLPYHPMVYIPRYWQSYWTNNKSFNKIARESITFTLEEYCPVLFDTVHSGTNFTTSGRNLLSAFSVQDNIQGCLGMWRTAVGFWANKQADKRGRHYRNFVKPFLQTKIFTSTLRKAERWSAMLFNFYQTEQCYTPEHNIFWSHLRTNLKFHTYTFPYMLKMCYERRLLVAHSLTLFM
jgi:hypothetical protein